MKKIIFRGLRFCIVGGMNTGLDILVFNFFLFAFPTENNTLLLGYNSLAYFVGAFNSFYWNKYWTFKEKGLATFGQIQRFALVTSLGIACNDCFLWLVSQIFTAVHVNGVLWSNLAKILAIGGSFLVSYLGMHFGVFRTTQEMDKRMNNRPIIRSFQKSISVILPAYNEEANIYLTIVALLHTFDTWNVECEIIVVNDGSRDSTASIVESMGWKDFRIRLINHPKNRGYGDALKTGFAAATKDLTFFMDSDGQFDIQDLAHFFPLVEQYGAVLGYRINRQDSSLRKLNAWGWKQLVSFFFGIKVRDIDCAFKLFRTSFFREVTLESGGAMINAEMLYKLSRAGYTYTEVGVTHLPRKAGRATGAKFSVIIRALGQLFYFVEKWKNEEQLQEEQQSISFSKHS